MKPAPVIAAEAVAFVAVGMVSAAALILLKSTRTGVEALAPIFEYTELTLDMIEFLFAIELKYAL
jgi:hypothetical protein